MSSIASHLNRPAAEIGDLAPNFNLKSLQGKPIRLHDFIGKKQVILWFSRGFTCPYCRGFMNTVVEGYEELVSKKIEIVQISANLRQSAIKFFRDDSLPPFPMVFDPDKRLFANYNIGQKGFITAQKYMVRSFAESAKRGEFGVTLRASALDIVDTRFLQRLHHHALTATDQAIIAINLDGRIQHRHEIGSLEDVPPAPTMIKFLEQGSPQI